MMSRHVFRRQADDSQLLLPGDRFGGVAERAAVARLHLHEHQRRSVARDNVQFATTAPVPAGNNDVPAAFELAAREIFAGLPQSDSGACHDAPRLQERYHGGAGAERRARFPLLSGFLRTLRLSQCTSVSSVVLLFDFCQRLVEDPNRDVRLLAREDERR